MDWGRQEFFYIVIQVSPPRNVLLASMYLFWVLVTPHHGPPRFTSSLPMILPSTVAELQKWTTNPDTTTSLYHNNNILFEYPIDRNTGEKISVSVVTILFVS